MLSDLLARLDEDPSPIYSRAECPVVAPSPGPLPSAAQDWVDVCWQAHRIQRDFAASRTIVEQPLPSVYPVRFRSTDVLELVVKDWAAAEGSPERLQSATFDLSTRVLTSTPYRPSPMNRHFHGSVKREAQLRSGCTVAVCEADRSITVTRGPAVLYRYAIHPKAWLGTLWAGAGRRVGLFFRMRDHRGDQDTVITWNVTPDAVTPLAHHTAPLLGMAALGPAARLAYSQPDPKTKGSRILSVVEVS